jgi:pheromone shutdown protein TraB
VLIDERDLYMAEKIYRSGGVRILAVVGAGHVPGISRALGTEVDLVALERLPPKGWKAKAFQWSIPLLFLFLFVLVYFRSGAERSLEMAGIWAVTNGAFAGIGAALSLCHPVTAVVAMLSAPFAALHPLIAVGWVCALVEAGFRRPRISDFESIAEDILHIKTIWTNRVTHLFVLMALSNVGSIAGSALGIYLAAKS